MKISTKRFLVMSFLLALSVAWLVVTTNSASAAVTQMGMDTVGSQAYGTTQSETKDIRVIIIGIVNMILGFLGIIMVVLLIFSGYQWMTAGGDEKIIDTAKKRITNAVIGSLIILASWGISSFIMTQIVNVTANQ